MKVLHLNWIPSPDHWPGIVGKLHQQAAAVRRADLDIDVVILARGDARAAPSGLRFAPIAGDVSTQWLTSRTCRCATIARSIDLDRYDRIVLRYPGAVDVTFASFLRRWGGRLISEHHTHEVLERRLGGPLQQAVAWIEERNGPAFLAGCAGITTVTQELMEVQRARHPVPHHAVITNGIDVMGVRQTGARPFSGDELRIAFLAGEFVPWQGLDRLLRGLRRHRGTPRIVLHLIGKITSADQASIADVHREAPGVTITAHGMLNREHIDAVLSDVHIGVSTLALHRKGMQEACPLKSREYAARGLPFAYAYHDSDADPAVPGWFRLANDDEDIPVDVLVHAVEQIAASGVDAVSDAMRRHAASTLDWTIKLTQLNGFLAAIPCR